MTITIWIKPVDLEKFAMLVKKLETGSFLESEIKSTDLTWDDFPRASWIQAQISYPIYSILKES